jgi:hypothetical protein
MKTRPHPSNARQRVRRPSNTSARHGPKRAWGIRAFYSHVDAATCRDWGQFRLTLRPGLERDTSLMPWLIAESVCTEAARFLGVEIPARYAAWIEARAEINYAKRGHFQKLMRGRGDGPRAWLRVYMRHWLAGLLGLERPDLYEWLPDTFALGHPLPPPVHPRRRWHGHGKPLHPATDWNPRRVLEHRHWRWLVQRLPARTEAERQTLQNAVTATDQQIDALVYDLYGLTAEEIQLVEGTP